MIIQIYVWAWILIIIGFGFVGALVLYVKYSTEVSIKFYVFTIVVSSISLGFGIHLFLANFGI